MLQMLLGIFVRSVEDGLEPSQTYDEVNKLLLLLLLLLIDYTFLSLDDYIMVQLNQQYFGDDHYHASKFSM